MDCKHERLRAIGDRIFCCSCNAELTTAFFESLNASSDAQEPVKNPSDDARTNKSTSKKRTAKKAV